MIDRKLLVGMGTAGIVAAMALAPTAPAWAKAKPKAPPKVAATTGVAACPSAASLSAASGVTYTDPTTEKAAEKGWVVCQYNNSQGEIALLVSLYTKDFPLREVSANAPAATTKVKGIGNAASHFGTLVFVQRDSAPSFSVIDQSGDLTLQQTEAEAKAIVAG
jgi:hypothetical protein